MKFSCIEGLRQILLQVGASFDQEDVNSVRDEPNIPIYGLGTEELGYLWAFNYGLFDQRSLLIYVYSLIMYS